MIMFGIVDFLWHIVAIAICVSAIAAIASVLQTKLPFPFLMMFAVCVVGSVAGFWTTNNRISAMGNVIPGVLTLLAGFGLVAAARTPDHERMIATGVLCLALSFGIAATWGASNRRLNELEFTDFDPDITIRSMKARAMIEQEVNEFREALGVKPLSEEFFYLRKKGEQ